MKRIIISLVAVILTAGSLAAQDLAEATEAYNNAATTLSAGDKAGALDAFSKALNMAETLGEEGAEIASRCKNTIPNLLVSIAKEQLQGAKFDEAVATIGEAVKKAEEFGNSEVVAKAKALLPQAFLLKGKALLANGDLDAAEEAYQQAAANGQEASANKQIAQIYLKKAASALSGKDYQAAFDAAQKALSISENATAFKIAGTAAMKLEKKEDAINNLQKYIELSPTAKDVAQMKEVIEALKK